MLVSVDFDDLIQVGMIGLMDVVGCYKEDQGVQFEIYVMQCICGVMFDELCSNDWLLCSLCKMLCEVEYVVYQVEQYFGCLVSEIEIVQYLNMLFDEYQGMLQDLYGSQFIYYEDFDCVVDDELFFDCYCVDYVDLLLVLFDEYLCEVFVEVIEWLLECEKLLMLLYYEWGLNLCEIGVVFEVSELCVCQLYSQVVVCLCVWLCEQVWVGVEF